MTLPTLEEIKNIKPEYSKRIVIQQEVSEYGQISFHILHRKTPWHKLSSGDIPEYYRERKTFKAAERAAIYLLVNYKKIFS